MPSFEPSLCFIKMFLMISDFVRHRMTLRIISKVMFLVLTKLLTLVDRIYLA